MVTAPEDRGGDLEGEPIGDACHCRSSAGDGDGCRVGVERGDDVAGTGDSERDGELTVAAAGDRHSESPPRRADAHSGLRAT